MRRYAIGCYFLCFLALLLCCMSTVTFAQSSNSCFVLLFNGETDYNNVKAVVDAISKTEYVEYLVPRMARRGSVQYFGKMTGRFSDLEADVRSLAAGRFFVSVFPDKDFCMRITLAEMH